jgi:hypothetical protein
MTCVQDMLDTALHSHDPAQSSFAQLITGLHQMQLDFAHADAQAILVNAQLVVRRQKMCMEIKRKLDRIKELRERAERAKV